MHLKKYNNYMGFASNLKDILDFRDIEVKELAAGTGISKSTIDNYLSGQKSIPNAENAVKIAQFVGTTVEYLVTGNEGSSTVGVGSDVIADLYRMDKNDLGAIKTLIRSLAHKYKR